jgi:hypothetical protein
MMFLLLLTQVLQEFLGIFVCPLPENFIYRSRSDERTTSIFELDDAHADGRPGA